MIKKLNNFNLDKFLKSLKKCFYLLVLKKKNQKEKLILFFTLFKKVISLGNENKLKNSSLDGIEHVFPPPEEREKIRKQEEM